jgi:hypothetical protein
LLSVDLRQTDAAGLVEALELTGVVGVRCLATGKRPEPRGGDDEGGSQQPATGDAHGHGASDVPDGAVRRDMLRRCCPPTSKNDA